MNLSRIPTLPTVPQTGVWYRGVPPHRYPSDILQTAYTIHHSSRFFHHRSDPVHQTLYLARSPEIALRELEALYGPSGGTLSNLRAVTLFNMEVQLQRLVDLTDPDVQAALQTTVQELTGDWRVYSVLAALASLPLAAATAPTQQLGTALFTSGVEGLLTPSAKVPTATSLVVFPENLRFSSFIRHVEPATGKPHQL